MDLDRLVETQTRRLCLDCGEPFRAGWCNKRCRSWGKPRSKRKLVVQTRIVTYSEWETKGQT